MDRRCRTRRNWWYGRQSCRSCYPDNPATDLGLSLGYQDNKNDSFDAHTTNFGGFGTFYPFANWTFGVKGGGYTTDPSYGGHYNGTYFGGQAIFYPTPC